MWPENTAPTTEDVSVLIHYFSESATPDVDNIIKPIQDAFIGLVYGDDSQVKQTSSIRRDLNGRFEVRGMPSTLAQAFSTGSEFVRIRVALWSDDGSLK